MRTLHPPLPAAGNLASAWIPSPLGPMVAVADDAGLLLLDFADRRDLPAALARIAAHLPPDSPSPPDHPHLSLIARELRDYFAGDRLNFTCPLAPTGTPFELRAWTYLRTIPPGETRTYGQQAATIASPAASRAVGRANGNNFLAIVIPCHRVIGAAGKLTGYGGGLHRKAWLLEHELRVRMELAAR